MIKKLGARERKKTREIWATGAKKMWAVGPKKGRRGRFLDQKKNSRYFAAPTVYFALEGYQAGIRGGLIGLKFGLRIGPRFSKLFEPMLSWTDRISSVDPCSKKSIRE